MVSSSAACCARAGVSAKREAAAIKRMRTVATPQNSLFLRLPHTNVLDFIGRPAASQVARQADLYRTSDLHVFECRDCDISLIEATEDLESASVCG
jgi:hypothetical protein